MRYMYILDKNYLIGFIINVFYNTPMNKGLLPLIFSPIPSFVHAIYISDQNIYRLQPITTWINDHMHY